MTMEMTEYREPAGIVPADEGQVSGLVRLAIEQNVSVEMLERLVALQERVTDRNARTAFMAALSAFQAECPPLKKARDVDYTTRSGVRIQYSFATLDSIAETIRPFLSKHGLSYSWDSEVTDGNLAVTCTVQHVEGATRSATFRCKIDDAGSSTMNGPQKAGAATSYGQRYSLIQALGLTTADEDRDGGPQLDSVETISREQAADLTALLDEVGIDHDRFLKWAGAATIEEMPLSKLAEAIANLEAQRDA